MMTPILVTAVAGFVADAHAQSTPQTTPQTTAQTTAQTTPGVVVQGSASAAIGGHSAARQGDVTTNGVTHEGSKDVFINGTPAAIGSSKTDCNGIVVGGVFVTGKPAARSGHQTSGRTK